MSRIQKKCFIASTGFHLLLVVLLFVGPAFLSSNSKMDDSMVLTFVPMMTTDEKIAGGGSPKGGPPPPLQQPRPEPPKPAVAQKVEKAPAPDPQPAKVEKNEAALVETGKPHKVNPNLERTTRKPSGQKAPTTVAKATTSQSPSKEMQAFDNSVKNLRSGLSSATAIEMPAGPGGGGVPYANFYDGVKKIYSDAWVVPDGVTDDLATVTASVTIARDGTVLDTSIIARSGNVEVDESVAATLRRVRRAVPLPEGAKEDQRTVKIKFNVRAQRLLG